MLGTRYTASPENDARSSASCCPRTHVWLLTSERIIGNDRTGGLRSSSWLMVAPVLASSRATAGGRGKLYKRSWLNAWRNRNSRIRRLGRATFGVDFARAD